MPDSRQRILSRIRDSLGTTRASLEAQAAAYPPPHGYGPFITTELDPVEQFRAELSALHAHVHLCDGPDAAIAQVLEIMQLSGAREFMAWQTDELPLPALPQRLADAGMRAVDPQVRANDRRARYAELEPVTAGITGVHAAVAESGSMILLHGAGRPRLASLLPPVHIALLPAERIVRTLPEAFDRLRAEHGRDPFRDRSNLVVITGPSRTADIELSLTLGVHGPRDVHAVVIRPSAQP